jgi:transposase-like protein
MAKNLGLHLSEAFLRQRYVMQKRSPEDIAKECGVSIQIIYKQLNKFGLRR